MNLLDFANPLGGWWLLLGIPIALLYILKVRLRRQTVPTLLFWDQVFDEKKPRSWWQQVRHLLSLLLQLAFLGMLVAALVDPLWSWQKNQQRHVALILDNSASMEAIEANGESRLTQAKKAARGLVRSLRGNDRMAILTAAGQPRVAMGLTDHQRPLLDVIESLAGTEGPTEVGAAVALARRLLSDIEGEFEIIVLSDACVDEAEDLASDENVQVYGFGSALPNLGITRFQVRRSLIDAIGYQVLIDVTNFSEDDSSCRLELNLHDMQMQPTADGLIDVIPLEFGPGETVTRILDHTSAEGGTMVASLNAEDGLASDNVAIAVLPNREKIPIVLATEGNLFLKSVLESIPLVSLTVVSEAPKQAPPDGILVLDRNVPQQLPKGNVLVVDPQSECDEWKLGDALADPIVAHVDSNSPLTQHVRLNNVTFPGARRLDIQRESIKLIRDPLDQPLLAQIRRQSGDAVVLTCSLEQGDLPLRIAFPVLMKNAIEWFQGIQGELRPASSTGQMVAVDVQMSDKDAEPTPSESGSTDGEVTAVVVASSDEGKHEYVLVSPSDQTTPIAISNDQAVVGPLMETGLWTIQPNASADGNEVPSDTASSVPLAINLANPQESDLRPRFETNKLDSVAMMSLGGRSLWFYLTLVAATLIATEWWLYQRRIVG